MPRLPFNVGVWRGALLGRSLRLWRSVGILLSTLDSVSILLVDPLLKRLSVSIRTTLRRHFSAVQVQCQAQGSNDELIFKNSYIYAENWCRIQKRGVNYGCTTLFFLIPHHDSVLSCHQPVIDHSNWFGRVTLVSTR